MLDYLGFLIVVELVAYAWINFEMYVADQGPLYDEDYRPIPGT